MITNAEWAHWLIDQLIQQGVERICISPGSRSTPLALAATRHPHAKITAHFDERGIGFYALGIAMASQVPCAIITTSGSAVGNLIPSVQEAFHSQVGLILLTADRPPQLQDCGAPQTMEQTQFLRSYLRWQLALPLPNGSPPARQLERFIRSTASHAFFRAQKSGPVQLNCPFEEPLYEACKNYPFGKKQERYLPSQILLEPLLIESVKRAKKGIILLGRLPPDTEKEPFFTLARTLKWPIFADLLSQMRTEETIEHYELLLRSNLLPSPEGILHFGERFTAKIIPNWIEKTGACYWHISDSNERFDPNHLQPVRIQMDPASFCKSIDIEPHIDLDWQMLWQDFNQKAKQQILTSLQNAEVVTEAHWMRALSEKSPAHGSLFLANSMPIRNAEWFFTGKIEAIFANRGLSGIDGQIATAVGIGAQTCKPVIACIGDLASLHDLNSLSLLQSLKSPFFLCIFNNFGGEIFSHLPIDLNDPHFDLVFGSSHRFHFQKAAEQFNLSYHQIKVPSELFCLFERPGVHVIEILTSKRENISFQQQLFNYFDQFVPTEYDLA